MPSRTPIPSPALLRSLRLSLQRPSCAARSVRCFSRTAPRVRLLNGGRANVHQSLRYSRPASTVASRTAINPTSEVLPERRELFEALGELKGKAANYVNLSRLQLALRGLEARSPVVRVAVLGIDSQAAARRLVKALLAESSAPVEDWEERIEALGRDEGRAFLVRYGDTGDPVQQNPLLATLNVPSPLLRDNNLELLVTSINTNVDSSVTQLTADAALVPSLETPASSTGRHTRVTYPVHRAILCGEGIDGAVAYGRSLSGIAADAGSQSIAAVFNAASSSVTTNERHEETFLTIDIDALASPASPPAQQSRQQLHALLSWLTPSTPTSASLSPALTTLISSLLTSTLSTIQRTPNLHPPSPTISPSTRLALSQALHTWSEQSHLELRDALDAAFISPAWRSLSWWKLPLRIDDISLVCADILRSRYLVQAEKDLIFLAGRLAQAGLIDSSRDTPERAAWQNPLPDPARDVESEQRPLGSAPLPPLTSVLWADYHRAAAAETDPHASPLFPPRPWPQTIPHSRNSLYASIPPLHRTAQSLLLRALSTLSASSALAALVLVAGDASFFEAGAVAAVGLVWAARRLQDGWESVRGEWVDTVREEGRMALRGVEAEVGEVVDGAAAREGEGEGLEGASEVVQARMAVERVGRALKGLGGRVERE
ncbi:MAG: hypothetical protein M1824_004048 [Vezdaea acicularis]|nr:MAG: hypothetical protein M1824_004048 [Vezdaea acicularis]